MFGTGMIGDTFEKRKVLAFSLTVQGACFVGIGLVGYRAKSVKGMLAVFCCLFALIGLI